MRPKERRDSGQNDLFRARLDQIVDIDHPLAKLGRAIAWRFLDVSSRALLGHPCRMIRRMRYGTNSTRERHNDGAAVFRVKRLEGATACDP